VNPLDAFDDDWDWTPCEPEYGGDCHLCGKPCRPDEINPHNDCATFESHRPDMDEIGGAL
jgi:hypothetical protein